MRPQDELQAILEFYQLGELSSYVQDERGFVNVSYAIESIKNGEKKKYFLRKYKQGVKEKEIRFEHSLIKHLLAKEFPLVAGVLPTKEDKSYVSRAAPEGNLGAIFYAIFDFLQGEDRYTWIDPTCNDEEIASAAQVLAQFHHAVFGFQPEGSREEPEIVKLLPLIAKNVSACAAKDGHTRFDAYLQQNRDLILEHLKLVLAVLNTPEYLSLPRLVIHCDYHPGNLKFQQDKVIGLFDFDWSKIDTRCFDVALALNYFFIDWHEQDGQLQLDGCARFLSAYQDTLQEISGVGPLSPDEIIFLPHLISASNLYVLNWTVADYYHKEVDPEEYLIYLKHGINFINWLKMPENQRKLAHLTNL
ncbi:MAG TPA: phosphotransferase [Anaerolineales bacterium]